MTVPTYDQFIEPLLRYLAAHPDGAKTSDAHEAVADRLGLTADDRAARIPSGVQPLYKNRNGWAHDRLKRAGFSTSPKIGFWRLTPEGVAYAAKHKTLTDQDIEVLARVDKTHHLQPKKDGGDAALPAPSTLAGDMSSPEEQMDAALAEVRERVARELLENIGRAPPAFFEQLVLELLHKMDYGTSPDDLQRVGGSGDEGIDGIISLDRLGLEKVYIQAKRWKKTNPVGSPDIQGFMGALQLQGAAKGVFITTSAFTKDAKAAAAKARGSIVLVDGEQLTNLMMDHGVGVSHKTLRVPRVESDYFEDV